jgi:hypothetical protein
VKIKIKVTANIASINPVLASSAGGSKNIPASTPPAHAVSASAK